MSEHWNTVVFSGHTNKFSYKINNAADFIFLTITTKTDYRLPPRCKCNMISFFNFKQHKIEIPYRRFGTNYQSHLQGFWTACPLRVGPVVCHGRSVRNYHSALRKMSKQCRSQLRTLFLLYVFLYIRSICSPVSGWNCNVYRPIGGQVK
jgi:hypothetical protein